MLVLSRGQNEDIVFPDLDIHIRFFKTSVTKTKVMIAAPGDVRIVRGELLYPPGQHPIFDLKGKLCPQQKSEQSSTTEPTAEKCQTQ